MIEIGLWYGLCNQYPFPDRTWKTFTGLNIPAVTGYWQILLNVLSMTVQAPYLSARNDSYGNTFYQYFVPDGTGSSSDRSVWHRLQFWLLPIYCPWWEIENDHTYQLSRRDQILVENIIPRLLSSRRDIIKSIFTEYLVRFNRIAVKNNL